MTEDLPILVDENRQLTDWLNEPTIEDLKVDYENSISSHDTQCVLIDSYIKYLEAKPLEFKSKKDNLTRSKVVPKLIRKQAEWRYSSLSEPFLSTSDIFRVNPVSYEDNYSAKQNELVLNYQFNTQINKIKLIDEYVRDAVNTGTAIMRVGWEEKEDFIDVPVPQYVPSQVDPSDTDNLAKFERVKRMMADTITVENVPDYWKQCVIQAQQEEQQREQEVFAQVQQQLELYQQQGVPEEQLQQIQEELLQQAQQQLQSMPPIAYAPQEIGVSYERVSKTINRPTIDMCYYHDVYIDPTCEGNIDRAEFIIYKYNSCKADLLADSRYVNVDLIPDDAREYDSGSTANDFRDKARKKVTVYEYWGNWDINNDGTKVPIVATWVGDVMIRLQENPYPDHKPPFVIVPYLPRAKQVYGEPDGALISDNQDIIGAVTRGVIDLLAKSANSQTGMAMQFLDPVNKKAFDEGRDYQFNPTMTPQQAIFQHAFPEIPQTILPFLQTQEMEAEALTGVKSYNQGISGESLGPTAAGVQGVLDSASKREMGILRRLSDGLKKVARKIIAMNALWLNDTEVIRITNQDFVEIHRDDLAGEFDLDLTISSAEQDNAKAESLAFMLQTLGNTVDQGMTQMILSEICRLRKMPELAERVARFTPPPPDPMQQKMQEMQIELLQSQINKLQAEVQKLGADTELSGAKAQSEIYGTQLDMQLKPQELMSKIRSEQAKAEYNQSMAQKLNLDYLNDVNGIKHNQDLELMSQQAKAQADKSMQEKYMDYLIEKEKTKQQLNKRKDKK